METRKRQLLRRHRRGKRLFMLMALLVLAVAIRFGLSLVLAPADVFSMAVMGLRQ